MKHKMCRKKCLFRWRGFVVRVETPHPTVTPAPHSPARPFASEEPRRCGKTGTFRGEAASAASVRSTREGSILRALT